MLIRIGNYWVNPESVKAIKLINNTAEWSKSVGSHGERMYVYMKESDETFQVAGDQELVDATAAKVNDALRSMTLQYPPVYSYPPIYSSHHQQ
jgi:hypothetical protein